jgi:hypothetical protein
VNYVRNIWPPSYVTGKERSTLVAFSDNCAYVFDIRSELNRLKFCKGEFKVKSETISVKFLCSYFLNSLVSQVQMAHIYNPSYLEGRTWRELCLEASLGKKQDPISKNNQHSPASVAHVCNSSHSGDGRIMVRNQPGQIVCKTLSRKYSTRKGLME